MKNLSEVSLGDEFFFDENKRIFSRKVVRKIVSTVTTTTILSEIPDVKESVSFVCADGYTLKDEDLYEDEDELMISKIKDRFTITTVVEGEEYNLKRISATT